MTFLATPAEAQARGFVSPRIPLVYDTACGIEFSIVQFAYGQVIVLRITEAQKAKAESLDGFKWCCSCFPSDMAPPRADALYAVFTCRAQELCAMISEAQAICREIAEPEVPKPQFPTELTMKLKISPLTNEELESFKSFLTKTLEEILPAGSTFSIKERK